MNAKAGMRFGPVVCRVHSFGDIRWASRLLAEKMRHMPQTVCMDIAGNVHVSPGHEAIPPQALPWVIGTYNKDCTVADIASDLAAELRTRKQMEKDPV